MAEMSYAHMHSEFEKKYWNEVVPALKSYESERKSAQIKATLSAGSLILLSIVIAIIMIIADYSGYSSSEKKDGYKLPIYIFVGGIAVYHIFKKKFENKIKEKVMPIVCKCFENISWSHISPNGMDDEVYKRVNLIDTYDRLYFDDCFKGSYNDTNYTIEEFEATYGSGKHRTTVFKGAVVSIIMHKPFSGKTVIRSNSLLHWSPSKDLHHTELEDIVFEKKFDVYTDDDVEARYLITTALMERLNNMKLAFRANKISVSFYNSKIYIALHTNKDLFSIGSLRKNVCDYDQFKTMFEEIYSIVNLIDYFKLDQMIGL